MEKVMYVLWRRAGMEAEAFSALLCGQLVEELLALPVAGLQLNVADADVAPGSGLVPDGLRRAATEPQMEAVLSVWLASAVPLRRAPVDEVIGRAGLPWAGYVVSESELLQDRSPAPVGTRSRGFAQVAFLQRPAGQSQNHWLSRWRDHHAEVAIVTQSTFEYRQNLVVSRLQAAGPAFAGIVEESFPIEALTDRAAFYDAVGDPELLASNRQRMASSTRTFIDHESGLDVVPTSQYVLRRTTSQ